MKGKEIKYQKGITLIALVITIVVLLILAGVTLSIVFNGEIINKSQQAVDTYSGESAKEKLSLALFDYKMGYITGGEKDLKTYLESNGVGVVTGGLENLSTEYIVEVDGYEFIISKNNLEITSNGLVTGEKPKIQDRTFDLVGEEKLSAIIKVTASATKGGALTVKIENQTATLENGTYNLEVTKNGKYTIIVEEDGLTRKAIETIEVSGIEKVKYTVTINKGTGIESVTESTEVENGNSLNIEATVANGYEFIKWNVTSGNASNVESLTSVTTTVTPTGNITIEATAGKPMPEVAGGNNLTGSANGTLNGKPATYQNPVIPVGFKISTEGASWILSEDGTYVTGWDDGLVIEDAETGGNQFVWVPCYYSIANSALVPYAKWCRLGMSYTVCNTVNHDNMPVNSETYQIDTYGGFYIGRYEASKPTSGTVPKTQYDKAPWVIIDYTNSKSYAESYQTSNFVKSGLLTGTMWDTALAWINTGVSGYATSTSYGNYSGRVKNTGKTTTDCVKNIYDLAGNVREWTGEVKSSIRGIRGGYYNDRDAPAYRECGTVTSNLYSRRFPSCTVCYIKIILNAN